MKVRVSWRGILQIIVVVTWITSISWMILDHENFPNFDAIITFLGATATFIGSFKVSDEPIIASSGGLHDRYKLLEKVRFFWIEGFLESSLRDLPYINPTYEFSKGAVKPAWGLLFEGQYFDTKRIPPDASPYKIFEESGHEMLILGDPGSGKTTLMLQMVRDLLNRAVHDESYPIPIIFNLSSWAAQRHPIEDWVVNELALKYQVPEKIGKVWLEKSQISLMLDGLDEVIEDARAACITAINDFRKQHMLDVLVCCRTDDYYIVNTLLCLPVAIVLKPLTYQQVDAHLAEFGERFEHLRHDLINDAKLQELVSRPLMLNVTASVYSDIPLDEFHRINSIDETHQYLLFMYTKKMLKTRAGKLNISPKMIVRWLSNLAQKMLAHNQTIYLIEEMQPDWLEIENYKLRYRLNLLLLSCVVGLSFSCLGEMIGLLVTMPFTIPWALPQFTVLNILIATIYCSKGVMDKIKPVEQIRWRPHWSWKGVWRGFKVGLLLGGILLLFSCIAISFTNYLNPSSSDDLFIIGFFIMILTIVLTLVFVLFFAILGGITGGIDRKWMMIGLIGGPVSYPIIFLSIIYEVKIYLNIFLSTDTEGYDAFLNLWQFWAVVLFIFGLLHGFFLGFIGAFVGSIINSLQEATVEIKMSPNQGIHQSVINAGIIGFVLLLTVGLSNEVLSSLIRYFLKPLGISGAPIYWEIGYGYGAVFGLVGALRFGGRAAIQHYALRITLDQVNLLPFKLESFLDKATRLIFLRRVGGGYMFIHRSLLEYFAHLKKTNKQRQRTTSKIA